MELAGPDRNVLIELNVDANRHLEVQVIGNGDWCVALGLRDCSAQMHEQKLVEASVTAESLQREIAATDDRETARALEAELRVLTEMGRRGGTLRPCGGPRLGIHFRVHRGRR